MRRHRRFAAWFGTCLCAFPGCSPRRQRTIVDAAAAAGVHIDTSLTYCHNTLLDRTLVTSGFLEWAGQAGIGIVNGSPVGMGLLTEAGPPPWHPAKPHQKQAAAAAAVLAKAAGVNISRLAVRFSATCPGVASTLFSVETRELMLQNVDAVLAPPTEAEVCSRARH